MIDSGPWERQTETWRNEVLSWRRVANDGERRCLGLCLSVPHSRALHGRVFRGPSLGRTHPGPLKPSRTQRTFVAIGYVTHCLLY